MSSELLDVARREAERLRLVLSVNEDFQKLQNVQRMIDIYESFEAKRSVTAEKLSPVAETMVRVLSTLPVSRPGSKVALVDEIMTKHFKKVGVRGSSGDLLPIVTAAGVEMTGKVPAKTLSSFLTNSKRFNNVKGLGYGLVEWGDGPGPNASPGDEVRQQVLSQFLDHEENKSGAGDDRS